MANNGLLERLKDGGTLCVAEGYIFEFERRGYLQAGTFVPEVNVDHPELVVQLYEEFIHAGSDVVLAFTYYAHREKLKVVGRENEMEAINGEALRMAREVADKHGVLMAGNICNSTVYERDNPDTHAVVEAMYKEQIELILKHKADFIVAETYMEYQEAAFALECIKKYGKGIPAVMTLAPPQTEILMGDVNVIDACKMLEDAGAAVVGLNCGRGPATTLPLMKKIREVCKGPIAALPVVYRTTTEEPTFWGIKVPGTDKRAFPLDLPALQCSRSEVYDFAVACKEMGIQYVGLCCGNASHYMRIVAEVYDKNPKASRYAPAMAKHFIFGDQKRWNKYYCKSVKEDIAGYS